MLEIGGRKVGWGQKPIISAELGLNYNNSLDTALEMIKSVAACGADAVKVQYFKADDFAEPGNRTINYRQMSELSGKFGWIGDITQYLEFVTENYYEFFKRNEISLDFVEACYRQAKKHGLIFGVTTTSTEGVREIAEANLTDYFKVASDMVGKTKMIEFMRETDLPAVLSTGQVDLSKEINHIYDDLVLHCVSEYPCKNPKLWKIRHMQEMGYNVGYSDHTQGIKSAIRAMELGAIWVEKHFTLDRTMPGPDHWFSADPMELEKLCKAV